MKLFVLVCLLNITFPLLANEISLELLLNNPSGKAEIMSVDYDPRLNSIAAKIKSKLMADNKLAQEIFSKKKSPDSPLPYDTRLGITKDEYDIMLSSIKNMKLKKIGMTDLVIKKSSDGSFLITSSSAALLSKDFIIKNRTLSSIVGTISNPLWIVNDDKSSPFYSLKGYSWKKNEISSTDIKEVDGVKRMFMIGKLQNDNTCIINVDYMILKKDQPTEKDQIILKYDCK